MNEIIKVCKKHGELTIDFLIKARINTNGEQAYRCKICMQELHRDHYKKNKEKVLLAHDLYRQKDPLKYQDIKNSSKRKMYALNPEKYRELSQRRDTKEKKNARNKIYREKIVNNLSDVYVKKIISDNSGLSRSCIPGSWVGVIKECIKLKRKIKEIKKCHK